MLADEVPAGHLPPTVVRVLSSSPGGFSGELDQVIANNFGAGKTGRRNHVHGRRISGSLLCRRDQPDNDWYMSEIDPRLPDILRDSFCIRTSMIRRRSGGTRTVETTYHWDGARQIVLSGYPGPRDWVANINANPTVTLHTAEFEPSFDIPGRGRGTVGHNERLPPPAQLHRQVDGEAGVPAPPIRHRPGRY